MQTKKHFTKAKQTAQKQQQNKKQEHNKHTLKRIKDDDIIYYHNRYKLELTVTKNIKKKTNNIRCIFRLASSCLNFKIISYV